MKVNISKICFLILLRVIYSSSQSCFREQCPYNYTYENDCYEDGQLGGPLYPDYCSPVNCSQEEVCTQDGCNIYCTKPEFRNESCTDPEECECYFGRTYNTTCPETQLCCYDYDTCAYECKEKIFRRHGFCPNPANTDYSFIDCVLYNTWCFEDSDCSPWEKCCPGLCHFISVCSYQEEKTATCPEQYEDGDSGTEATLCSSHEECTENCQLCCKLYSDSDEKYCRDPEYTYDDNVAIY